MNGRTQTQRVVAIGASAGGIDALKIFFAAMPADSGMAFVVIQHLDPAHVSYMAGLLAKYTTMAVLRPKTGWRSEPTLFTRFLLISLSSLKKANYI
jgi:chemotaxis response regulator CheB